MTEWDLSCRDWERRILAGETLIPPLPLFTEQAELATAFFNLMRLPDVFGTPLLREAAGDWFRDIVAALFGSRDPATHTRYIRELFALVPKGSSKTTYGAALMLTALLMNETPRAEYILVGPTQAIADRAMSQAVGMINLDATLRKRFQVREHTKEIIDRAPETFRATLRVKTFDLNIMTGTGAAGVLLDEIHLLGAHPATGRVMRQVRGGLEKTGGFLVIITTQSDVVPAGAFREELIAAREIRDGVRQGRMLPVLYEFPPAIARDQNRWENSDNWRLVMPNLGRPMVLESLVQDWEAERVKGEHAIRVWASQHLNIEIGMGLRSDRWAGAIHWEKSADKTLTLESLIERSEVITAGLDGGGADDLFGLIILGRERETKNWLLWARAWCHREVLTLRRSIASNLTDFASAGELIISEDSLSDIQDIVEILDTVRLSGLLAGVGADPWGIGEIVDALAEIDITQDNKLLWGVRQGVGLMGPIKTAERRLVNGTLKHSGSALMAWCVANIKIEPTATAFRPTKANAGDAKIDPTIAMFNAISIMSTNPEAAGGSIWDNAEYWTEDAPA